MYAHTFYIVQNVVLNSRPSLKGKGGLKIIRINYTYTCKSHTKHRYYTWNCLWNNRSNDYVFFFFSFNCAGVSEKGRKFALSMAAG